MGSEIVKPAGTAVALPETFDPYKQWGDSLNTSWIIGDLLKFNQTGWVTGDPPRVLALGTTMLAHMGGLVVGWVKWWDNKPVDQRMCLLRELKQPLPKREALPDLDESFWQIEVDKDGKPLKPRDPWQRQQYLPMLSDEGVLYTYACGVRDFKDPVGLLSRQYAMQHVNHPTLIPKVRLMTDQYKSKIPGVGWRITPMFEPAGWFDRAEFDEVLRKGGYIASSEPTAVEEDETSFAEDVSDSIPF